MENENKNRENGTEGGYQRRFDPQTGRPLDAAEFTPFAGGAEAGAGNGTATGFAPEKYPRERRTPTVRDRVFFALALLCGFFFFDFVIAGGSLGTTVYFLALFTVTGIYLRPWQAGRFPRVCGALGVLLSLGFSLSGDGAVMLADFVAVEFLYLLFAGGISGRLYRGTDTLAVLGDVTRIFFRESTSEAGAVFRRSESKRDGGKLLRNLLKITIGVAFAVPVLCVVVPVLAEADGAFDAFLSGIPDIEIGDTLWHLVGALVLAPFTAGMWFSLRYNRKKPESKESEFREPRGLDPAVAAGFLGCLSACYLLYLFSQLGYFFSAFAGAIPASVLTAAGYARRGFGEMCGISALNLILIFVALVTRKKGGVAAKIVGAFVCFISAFSLVLIATALSKMLLYIRFYGMTVNRIYPSLFMLALALCFVLCIVRVFRAVPYLRVLTVFSALIVLFASYVDVGRLSAEYNVFAYLHDDYAWHLDAVDVDMMRYEIGDRAAPALLRLYREAEDGTAREEAARALDVFAKPETDPYGEKSEKETWRDFNLASYRGKLAVEEYKKTK